MPSINKATKVELEALPQVGPTKAQAIVDYCKAQGGVQTIEAIKGVDQLGDVAFQSIVNAGYTA